VHSFETIPGAAGGAILGETTEETHMDPRGDPRRRSAGDGVGQDRTGGIGPWSRDRLLPRLIGIGPEEIADTSRAGRLAVLKRLLRALRGERMRGRAGHWSYSLDRHIGLVRAVAAERREIVEIPGGRAAIATAAARPTAGASGGAHPPGDR
jgi:hypothetical protein